MSKTVEEIARETGFSITTVRFVISGKADQYRISASTKKQIEDYIALHGYSLNHAARSLKTKRSDTVGLVVPDLANAFFARFMAALEVHCRQRDQLLLTVSSHGDADLENRAITSLLARGVDGLVIAPCQLPKLPQLLRNKAGARVVMFDREYRPARFPTVISDNFEGSLTMTRRLVAEAGGPCHFLCGDAELPSIQDRVCGFRAALAETGLSDSASLLRLEADNTTLAGQKMMRALIDDLHGAPAAFMCSSLLVLEGALAQLRAQLGVIDAGILIATFDDHAMLDLLPNRVLSIKQNEAALASRVFERLHAADATPSAVPENAADIVASELICRNLD